MSREQKKLIYKLASGCSHGETLQQALLKHLNHYNRPSSRIEPLGTDESEVRFINVARQSRNMLLGVFHKLTKGAGQYVIEMTEAGESWQVTLMSPQAPGKAKREFVEGTLYFVIWKNHTIVHQSATCRTEQLQNYLSWLFGRPIAGRSSDKQLLIALADPISPELRKRSRQPVKGVRFGAAVETTLAPATKRAGVRFAPSGAVWEGIKKILQQVRADVPEDIFLENALGEQDIRVWLELSCTKRKSQSTAGDVLGILGRALSHSESTDYEVELMDGSKIRSREMKVETQSSVECIQKKAVPESLFAAMVDWMGKLIEVGTIIEQDSFGSTK